MPPSCDLMYQAHVQQQLKAIGGPPGGPGCRELIIEGKWPGLDEAFELAVQAHPKTFDLRPGPQLDWFTGELAFWMTRTAEAAGPAQMTVALKTMAVLNMVILLKPNRGTKGGEAVRNCIQLRIGWWQNGNIPALMDFCRKTLGRKRSVPMDRKEREEPPLHERIISMVQRGDIRSANALLDKDKGSKGLPIPITPDAAGRKIREKLQFLHPEPRPVLANLLLGGPDLPPDESLACEVDEKKVEAVASHLRGASGPSGLSTHNLRLACCGRGPVEVSQGSSGHADEETHDLRTAGGGVRPPSHLPPRGA